MTPEKGVQFDRYTIFAGLRLLLRDGAKVEINARAFDVLWTLVQADGELVSKEQLIDTVWSGAVVEDNNLQAQMSAIRRALGSDRDIIRTEFGRGYRLVAKGAVPRPGTRSTNANTSSPSNLPYPLTHLLGRAVDLREVERLFGKSRLVTITGTGGIGKTRLALELGRRLADRYPDGVRFAEIAKIGDEESVTSTLAAAVQIPASDITHIDRIGDQLSLRQFLLIVDNCEHLVASVCKTVETILRHAPSAKVLITSQEPLGLDGEQIYRLAPLPTPPTNTRDLDVAMRYAAFELFAERSVSNVQSLDIDVETASAICQRLDGLPLALELAAARVPTLGVPGVLTALDDRFNVLTAGRRTALSRHRTLRATVDWSFHLLVEDERRMLCRLALFAASFDAPAARAVAAPECDDPWSSLDLLGGLVGKSLVLLDLNQTTPRYQLLQTIRLYALEKLAERNDVDASAQRHAAYVAEITRRASDDWKTMSTEDWRATYEYAIEDIRAALDWSFHAKGNMRIGLTILACSTPFWIQLSLHDECRRRIMDALDRLADSIDPEDEMALTAALGTALSWAIGPVVETGVAWHKALGLAGELGAIEIELQARYGLWLYNLRSGRYRSALEHAEEMLRLASAKEDAEAEAVGRRICGVAQHFLGNHDLARELIERSLHWFEVNRPQQVFRFGLDQRIAGLAFLSRLLWVQGFCDRGREMASVATEDARALDHANTLCCALAEGWCTVHALDGDSEAVRLEADHLKRVAREHGLGFWSTYGDLFELWADVVQSGAVPAMRVAVSVASVERLGFDRGYSTLLSDIYFVATNNSRDEAAFRSISALMESQSADVPSWGEPEFRRMRAHRDDRTSIADLRMALSISHRQGARAFTLKIATDLASKLAGKGEDDEARSMLKAALEDHPPASKGVHLAEARALADRLGLNVQC